MTSEPMTEATGQRVVLLLALLLLGLGLMVVLAVPEALLLVLGVVGFFLLLAGVAYLADTLTPVRPRGGNPKP